MHVTKGQLEESFPRSDSRTSHVTAKSVTSFVPEDEQLFKSRRKQPITNLNKKKRSKKNKKKNESNVLESNNLNKVVIENLTLSRLVENTIIYGCIQEIGDFEIKFSITGGMIVTVPITNISSSYTKLIENFANNTSDADNIEITKLSTMFQIGEYYPVKIVSKRICDQFGHTEIIGSINPKEIHCNFTSKSILKLCEGYNIIASVVNEEDYGYEMDLGIHEVKAFLSFEDLKQNTNISKLFVGQLVYCSISKINDRTFILTTTKKSTFCFDQNYEPSVYSFLPGVKTKAVVVNVSNSGLELSLPGGYKGFVPRFHVSDDMLMMPKMFKIGDTVEGHVLYLHPYTKQVCLSLKTMLARKTLKNLIQSMRIGLIIDKAVVCGRSEYGSLIFKLPSNCYAFCSRKNLCEPNEFENFKTNDKFSIGSTHVSRVKKFHLFDNLIELSLKKSFIERKELSVDDLHVGAIVEGTVKKLKKNGIYVRLGFGMNGFIPNIHLVDAPLLNIDRNREKLFPIKKSIKCRITRLDLDSRIPRISLTAKKSLLNLDSKNILHDINLIRPGVSSTGVVCLINDNGILLEFFANVRGFIPLKYLATYKIEHPDKVFSIGQLVKCTVVTVDSNSQRIVCSLIDIKESKKLKIKAQLTDKKLINSELQVGQILKKMKIISKIPMKGFDLTNSKENIQVFLSITHLSDDPYLCRLLYSAFKIGDIFDEVMVFTKDVANVIGVTRKNVFLKQKELILSEEDITIDSSFPAIVRNVTHRGVFFEIPNSQYGVVRNKFLQDKFCEEPHRLGLFRGQTIYVTAVDFSPIDKDNSIVYESNYLKKFKFSMKLSQVWDKDDSIRLEMIQSYLKDHTLASNFLRNKILPDKDTSVTPVSNNFASIIQQLMCYSIGQVVTYVVTNIADNFIEANVNLTGNKNEKTVPAIAFKYTEFNDLSVLHMGNAVVCDVDFEKKALVIFIQPQPAKIVRQVRNSQKSKFIQNIKLEQTIKGTVIYTSNKYVLASLSGHAPGVIAYIPAKRHYNDFGNIEKLFSVGEDYQFSIKYVGESYVIAIQFNKSFNKNIEAKKSNLKQNKVKMPKETDTVKAELQSNEDVKSNDVSQTSIKADTNIKNTTNIAEFQWEIPDLTLNLASKRKSEKCEDILTKDSDEDISWDSDSEDEHKAKKRKTREERNEDIRQQEFWLRQKETELSNTERTPKDEQDFEIAVMASPNNSLVWLKYMAFFLENGEIDKARAIADRAIQRISYREEKEKLNVWIALINLENSYGDESTMNALIERAIKFNDPKVIYLQLANVYDGSNQKEKAEQTYNLLIKKFKQDETVWIEFLLFHMKNERVESARKLFQKSLLCLEKRHHVEIISKFGQLEFRYGDSEQGKTIFETMLATYWKRLDKWSIYIDMLTKYTLNEKDVDSIEYIRNIFERLLTFKFSPFKMKFIFKKYYEFESKFSADNIDVLERIQQKAAEYVENGIF